jgi:MFS superfamily sulfate permease-like transporter
VAQSNPHKDLKPGFRFTLTELSGALGDLGVLVPLALLMIEGSGFSPARVFTSFGLAYLISAATYQLPIPVQPLKSFAATAIALGLAAPVIHAGAWWMTIVFLGLAVFRLDRQISRAFPKPIVRGIQLGVGLLLLRSAWALVVDPASGGAVFSLGGWEIPYSWGLALGAAIVLLVMLRMSRGWAGLAVILFGALASLTFLWPVLDSPSLGIEPGFTGLPGASDFLSALWLLVLPQIPLSLGNAVFAAQDVTKRYYGDNARRVSPRRLLTTMGLNSLIAALLGGIPSCHGSGGVTAHYRLGARTGGAPLMLGIGFIGLGLFGGDAITGVVRLVPIPVLGVLLAYVGVQHARLVQDLSGGREWIPALTLAVVAALSRNLAYGFAAGLTLHFLFSVAWPFTKHRAKKVLAK